MSKHFAKISLVEMKYINRPIEQLTIASMKRSYVDKMSVGQLAFDQMALNPKNSDNVLREIFEISFSQESGVSQPTPAKNYSA
jgi:hypothetical protein